MNITSNWRRRLASAVLVGLIPATAIGALVCWNGDHGRQWGGGAFDCAWFYGHFGSYISPGDGVNCFDLTITGPPPPENSISGYGGGVDGAAIIGAAPDGPTPDGTVIFIMRRDLNFQACYRDPVTHVVYLADLPDLPEFGPEVMTFAHITRAGDFRDYLPVPPYTGVPDGPVIGSDFVMHLAVVEPNGPSFVQAQALALNFADLNFQVAPVPPCTADMNHDHAVNTADLTSMLSRFGQSVPPGTMGDMNGDYLVNTQDLTVMLGAFGLSCP